MSTPEITQDYLFREFLNPKPGQEAEFKRWNTEEHLTSIALMPGVLSARRYELAADQINPGGPAKGKYMNTYHVRAPDAAAFAAELEKRQASGEIGLSPTVDPDSVEYYSFHLLKKAFRGYTGMSAMDPGHPDYLEQIFDEPAPGKEDEYNAWADGYLQGLMTNPQFINAYRGLISPVSFGKGKHSARYFIQLSFRAPDVPAFAKALATQLDPPASRDESKHYAYTYKADGDFLMGENLKAMRAERDAKQG